MDIKTLRKKFVHFFEAKKHRHILSSSLIPVGDPSVLLTTAGMQQFKPYFLGERDPEADLQSKTFVSVQKCFRTSDINEVGDASHLTFFEMLGNFSVGGYFKKEAIVYAWEFMTKTISLPAARLWATYFSGEEKPKRGQVKLPSDQESAKIWQKLLPKERIAGFGHEENFWGPPGKTGPCGPCTELHFDLTQEPCELGAKCVPNCPCGRFLEVWNLVLMQYEKNGKGEYKDLPQKNIDTGMGLERLAMVLQGKQSVYQTDVFNGITKVIQADDRFGITGDEVEDIRRMRIVADHVKGSVFLRADEVRFSNKEQGYILRRIFRRACDQYLHPGFHLEKVVDAVISEYGEAYPDIKTKRAAILEDFQKEYLNYEKVRLMDIGKLLKQLPKEDILQQTEPLQGPSIINITGRAAVQLFTTYGTSTDQLRQKGFGFDEAEFEAELEKHRDISRSGAVAKFGGHGLNSTALSDDERTIMTRLHTATHLLQQALRDVLGSGIKQEGSDINPERLRFDFRYQDKLTPEQLLQIEAIVNAKISEDLPVISKEMPVKEALESGALAFFKEKYPEKVTVYSIGDYSKEFCGGPHVTHTSEIGSFKIISEKSASAGIRRIKAEVGK